MAKWLDGIEGGNDIQLIHMSLPISGYLPLIIHKSRSWFRPKHIGYEWTTLTQYINDLIKMSSLTSALNQDSVALFSVPVVIM